jgi:hypothetical protein
MIFEQRQVSLRGVLTKEDTVAPLYPSVVCCHTTMLVGPVPIYSGR